MAAITIIVILVFVLVIRYIISINNTEILLHNLVKAKQKLWEANK